LAKIVLTLAMLIQISFISLIWFPEERGLNNYFFLFAPMSFVIYNININIERVAMWCTNILSAILFSLSGLMDFTPMINLSNTLIIVFDEFAKLSTLFTISLVLYLFASGISNKSKKLEQLNEQLKDVARHDSLTGLYNKRDLKEVFEQKLHIAERLNLEFVLVMIDLNNFKTVNDKLGHIAGDQLLIKFASIAQSRIRNGLDDAFRIGGDEFLLMLLDCSENKGVKVASDIDKEFRKHTEISSLAYGVLAIDINKDATFEQLISLADKRMYLNKENTKR